MKNIAYTNSPYRNYAKNMARMERSGESKVKSLELVKFDISPTLIVWILSFLVAVLGLCFLFSYNRVATKGYYLKRLEVANQELTNQSQQINLAVSEAKSMTKMIADGRMDGLVIPKKVTQIEVSENFLASNQ